jgi:hypothetical protein
VSEQRAETAGTEYVITLHAKGDLEGRAVWGRLWIARGVGVNSDMARVEGGWLIQSLLKELQRHSDGEMAQS